MRNPWEQRARTYRGAAVVAGLLFGAGCSCSTTTEPPPAVCEFSVAPGPGIYTEQPTVVVTTNAAEDLLRYALATLPVNQAPESLPSTPVTVSTPSDPLQLADGLTLGNGYHQLDLFDPCAAQWRRSVYLVDGVAPVVTITPDTGTYASIVTATVSVDDAAATLYVRHYDGSVTQPPAFAATAATALSFSEPDTYTVEAYAVDRVGNASPVSAVTFTIVDPTQEVVELGLRGNAAIASRLPVALARFSAPMDLAVTVLPDAWTVDDGAVTTVDAIVLWSDDRTCDILPAERLPIGAAATLDIDGAFVDALGTPVVAAFGVDTSLELDVCAVCGAATLAYSASATLMTVPAAVTAVTFTATFAEPLANASPLQLGVIDSGMGQFALDASSALWSVVLAPDGTSATVTAAISLAGPAGTAFALQLLSLAAERSDGPALAFSVEYPGAGGIAAAGLTSTVDWLGTWPETDATVAAQQVLIAAEAGVNLDSLRDHTYVHVDGVNVPVRVAGVAGMPYLALVSGTQAWPAGALVDVTVAAGIRDLFGATITTTVATRFTVAANPSGTLRALLDRGDGAALLRSDALVVQGAVWPAQPAATLTVIDATTGHDIDAFALVVDPPLSGARGGQALTGFRVLAEPWLPSLPLNREFRAIVTFPGGTVTFPFHYASAAGPRLASRSLTGRVDAPMQLMTAPSGQFVEGRVEWLGTPDWPGPAVESVPATESFPLASTTAQFGDVAWGRGYMDSPTGVFDLLADQTADLDPGTLSGAAVLTWDAEASTFESPAWAPDSGSIPVLATPPDGANVGASSDVTFAWSLTNPTAPDLLYLIMRAQAPAPDNFPFVIGLPPSVTSFTLPRPWIASYFSYSGDVTMAWTVFAVRTAYEPYGFDLIGGGSLAPRTLTWNIAP